MKTVNNDPTHRLPERELERHHHQLLQRRHLRRRRRPRVGPRLHRVHPRPDLPVAVRCAQRVLLRHLGRDRRPDQRPHGRRRGRHRRQARRRPVLDVHPRRDRWSINSPASIAGPATGGAASFGPVFDQAGVTTDVVVGQDAANRRRPDHDRRVHGAHQRRRRRRQVRATSTAAPARFEVKANNAEAAGAAGIVVGTTSRPGADLDVRRRRHLRPDGHPRGRRRRIKSARAPVNVTIRDSGTDPGPTPTAG